jgi:hypothetical protein
LVLLNPKDPQDIIKLRELPAITLTKEMDDYFVSVHKTLNRRSGGSCLITLYQNNIPMGEDAIEINEQLQVRSVKPLDLRHTYHVRLSFPVQYAAFTPKAIDQMAGHWAATLQVFQSIVPELDVEYAQTLLLDDDSLPYPYIRWFYRYLLDRGIGWPEGPGGGIKPGGGGESPGQDKYPDPTDGGDGGRRGHSGGRYVQWLAIVAMQDKEK